MDKSQAFNDELLSAYLDGELSPPERAKVELRLEEDADARELVRELQSAAQSVRELPRATAPRDLKQQILTAAREYLHSDGDVDDPPQAESTTAWRIGRSPRSWIWAGLAVAAALLIMFIGDDAEHDSGMSDVAALGRGRASQTEPKSPVIDRFSSAMDDQVSGPSDALSSRTELGDTSGAGGLGMEALPETDGANRVPESGATYDFSATADSFFYQEVPQESRGLGRATFSKDKDASIPSRNWASQRNYGLDFESGEATDSLQLGVVVQNPEAVFVAQEEGTPSPPAYFVSVNVTSDAIRNGTVRAYFGRNQIDWVEDRRQGERLEEQTELARLRELPQYDSPSESPSDPDATSNLSDQSQQQARLSQASAVEGETEGILEESDVEQRLEFFGAEENPQGQVSAVSEVVAVQAQPEQIRGLLSDLAKDETNVRGLAVLGKKPNDVGGDSLETFNRFNRNADQALSQVAGTWYFGVPVEPTQPVRVEWSNAAESGGAMGGGGGFGGIAGSAGGERSVAEDSGQPAANGASDSPEFDSEKQELGRSNRAGLQESQESQNSRIALKTREPAGEVHPPSTAGPDVDPSPEDAADPSDAQPAQRFAGRYETENLSRLDTATENNLTNGAAWVISPLQTRWGIASDQYSLNSAAPTPAPQEASVRRALTESEISEERSPADADESPAGMAATGRDRKIEQEIGQRGQQDALARGEERARSLPRQLRVVLIFNVITDSLPPAAAGPQAAGAAVEDQ